MRVTQKYWWGAAAVAASLLWAGQPASASACPAGKTQQPIVLSTGVTSGTSDPLGTPDPEWTLVSRPGNTLPEAVFSVAKIADYADPRPMANWIHRNQSGIAGGVPGNYVYETVFWVPPNATVSSVNLLYAADDGVEFRLNNIAIGGYPSPNNIFDHSGFNQWHTLYRTASIPFGTGLNRLSAIVDNDAGSYGVAVIGGVNLCV